MLSPARSEHVAHVASVAATLVLVLVSTVVVIGLYGHLRCRYRFVDPLSTKLRVWDLDGWSVTHFALFAFVGFFFPGLHLGAVAFLCGVVWELVEHWMGRTRPSWLGGWGDCRAKEFEKHNANWWFGRYSDILMNLLGLAAGNGARRLLAGAVPPSPFAPSTLK